MPNWRVILWVKLIEAVCQLRPKALLRMLGHPERLFRAGMRWYSGIGKRVWCYEIWQWLFHDRRTRHGLTVAEFLKGGWELGRLDAVSARFWERGVSFPCMPPRKMEASVRQNSERPVAAGISAD